MNMHHSDVYNAAVAPTEMLLLPSFEAMGLKSSDDSRPTTWLDEIPEEEKEAIKELKKRTLTVVTPKMLEDPSLFYRFLKARDFNMKNAEFMLRRHIEWRREYKVDNILNDYELPEVLKLYGPIRIFGKDKEGSPCIYASIGKADDKGIMNSAKMIDIFKLNLVRTETALKMLKEGNEKVNENPEDQEKKIENILDQAKELENILCGNLNTKVNYIYDFDKLSFSTATNKQAIEFLINWIGMYQDNYPERIKAIYVINASFYFTILYSALKFIVASGVLKKVHFFGTEGWKDVLLDAISPDVLPVFLGGKRTDPDGNPLCKSVICHGQTIPECYYLSNFRRTIQREPGVKKLSVTRNKSVNLPIEVYEAGSYLEWEFETKSKDIGFSVHFKDDRRIDGDLEEVVPKQRISTRYEPETGIYKCERTGTYYLIFDNSYSWMFSKEIYYRVTVSPPRETSGSESD